MKKYALPLVLVGMFSLQACNEQTASTDSAAAPAAPAAASLESPEQRLSYGIAYGLGQRMAQDGMPMDIEAFVSGYRDGASGSEGRMTQEEIAAEMQAYQEKMVAEQQETQAALAEANLAAATTFLEENKAREGVIVTETGLQYEVLEAGDGASPGAEDTVEVHYRGTLVDGTEFDSSYARGETVTFGVGQVIPGWTEALQLMKVGSKYQLAIPPELGYGAGGAGQMIGPNSALIFEVELVSIPSQAESAAAE
jgi:FKBP-type peptidyl-prolyl cis-trans isomerase